MNLEAQGRQYHQWFGHGTSGVDAGEAPRQDLADAVGEAAVAARDGGRGAALAGALRDGGAGWLREALPVWVGSSGMEAGQSEREVAGPAMRAGAEALQEVGRALADGSGAEAVMAAGAGLAAALETLPAEDHRFGLRAARDAAVFRGLKRGTGSGWTDHARSNTWTPTGRAGAPGGGTAGPAHGGPTGTW